MSTRQSFFGCCGQNSKNWRNLHIPHWQLQKWESMKLSYLLLANNKKCIMYQTLYSIRIFYENIILWIYFSFVNYKHWQNHHMWLIWDEILAAEILRKYEQDAYYTDIYLNAFVYCTLSYHAVFVLIISCS